MAHAEHFLSRVARLPAVHADLALGLYRDAALVRDVTRSAAPDGAARLALALDHTPAPPHLIVERDGAFVTCLGAGMQVHDALVIDRARLDALCARTAELRERTARAEALNKASGGIGAVVRRLLERGHRLSREEMACALAIGPLWDREALALFSDLRDGQRELLEGVLSVKSTAHLTRTERGRGTLRAISQSSWALTHLAVIAGARAQREPVEQREALALEAVFGLLASSYSTSIALHGAWAVAQVGPLLIDRLEEKLSEAPGSSDALMTPLALASIGAASPALRERALAALRRRADPSPGRGRQSGAAEDLMVEFIDHLSDTLADQAGFHGVFTEFGQGVVLSAARKRGLPGWSSPDHVRPGLARARALRFDRTLLRDERAIVLLKAGLAFVGQARPEELYLEARDLERSDLDDAEADGLRLLVHQQEWTPAPAPVVRAAPRTGRNDPCPCASGRKYKRCCEGGAAGEPALRPTG